MTKDEALRLALGALKSCNGLPHWPAFIPVTDAIKAALEAKDEPVFNKPHLDIEGPLHVVCRCPACKVQPQRKPLTDEEIVLIVVECAASHQHTDIHFARAIEAKLKEKNE